MKRIEDNEGAKYRLEEKRLVEVADPNYPDEYREVRKTDLRRAFRTKRSTTEIDYRYADQVTKTGKPKYLPPVTVDLFVDEDTVRLGCRTFEGKHAKALVRWATA